MIPEAVERDRAAVAPIMEWYRWQLPSKRREVRRLIAGVRVELWKFRSGWYERQRRAAAR